MGERIGTIEKIGKDHFTISSPHDLQNGDGIFFSDGSGVPRGSVVNSVEGARVYPDKMSGLTRGTVIFRNHDHAFLRSLGAKTSCERKIGLFLTLGETEDGFFLTACDEEGHTGAYAMAASKQAAEKEALAKEILTKQLSKVHDTVFTCGSVKHSLRQVYFFPMSLLNALRRGAIARLLEAREQARPRDKGTLRVNDTPYPLKTLDYRGNCLNKKAAAFYRRHGTEVVEMAAESGLPMRGRLLMRSKYCVKRDLGLCGKDTGPLFLIDENGRRYRLKFDCAACCMSVFESAAFSD